jgi:hypothetical protein
MKSQAAHSCAEYFNHDEHTQHDTDYDPDMLTDEGIYTGQYTICCVVLQLTLILKTRAPD